MWTFWKRRRRSALERTGPATTRLRFNGAVEAAPTSRLTARPVVATAMILLVWAAATFAYLYRARGAVDLVVGQTATNNILAQVDFEYEDRQETEQRRNHERQSVLDYYVVNSVANEDTLRATRELLAFVTTWEPGQALPEPAPDAKSVAGRCLALPAAQQALLKRLLDSQAKREYFSNHLEACLQRHILPPEARTGYHTSTITVAHLLDKGQQARSEVALKSLPTPGEAARQLLGDAAQAFGLAGAEGLNALADDLLAPLLQPNLNYDDGATKQAQRERADAVAKVTRAVPKDTIIVKQGDRLTEAGHQRLKAHNMALAKVHESQAFERQLQFFLLLSLSLLIGAACYLNTTAPRVFMRRSRILLVGVVLTISLLLTWSVEQGLFALLQGTEVFTFAALPLLLAPVLISLLLGPTLGMTVGLWAALLAALVAENGVHVLLLGVLEAVVGALAVRSSRTRLQTFRAALYVPLAVVLVESAFLLLHETPLHDYLIICGAAAANGVVTVVIVNLLLPFCETIFGITTNISLLELGDLNHPLLKRLRLEAPGTFHHTLMVATLAEHAAEAIGANTLLTRVAAYFHDIGKLSNPPYFTENNIDSANQHEELNPRMSVRVIVNHVKEGLAMAREYRLKEPIREAIATHHGTSLVYFFYHRARHGIRPDGEPEVEEDSYRYPGPLPRSPEATIISLADTCEAASRSLEKPTPQRIDALINELIRKRLLDGQLDHSELSLMELHQVSEAIKQTLRNMLHGRIAYPKEDTEAQGPTGTRKLMMPRSELDENQPEQSPARPAAGPPPGAAPPAAPDPGADTADDAHA